MILPPVMTDAYKVSHKGFMVDETEMIYSNWTARSDKHFPVKSELWDKHHVVFGIQGFCQKWLVAHWNEWFFHASKPFACKRVAKFLTKFFGTPFEPKQFEELHDLGYLPVRVKALREGTLCPIGVPSVIMFNTDPRFAWLTNYLETLFSAEVWKVMTVATIAREYRKLCFHYAELTCDNKMHLDYQCHDFSARGAHGIMDAANYGAGHLLFFKGTDTLPAVAEAEFIYKEGVEGTSIPASEHSVACLNYAVKGELESFKKWVSEDYPTGLVSLVADTTDYWKVLSDYLPTLKDIIMSREGKVVIRPDSGDPADIICGFPYDVWDSSKANEDIVGVTYYENNREYFFDVAKGKMFKIEFVNGDLPLQVTEVDARMVKGSIELLWETFGGTTNSKGFKELDSHIGLIYGDSITYDVAKNVFERLKAKDFASSNIVFGIGSFTYNFMTRDTLGFAVKATAAIVGGEVVALQKNPVTDDGTKKSAKGFLGVYYGDDHKLFCKQGLSAPAEDDAMVTYFNNGELPFTQTFTQIKQNLGVVV